MFKSVIGDIAGTGDNCRIINKSQFGDTKVVEDSLTYLMRDEVAHVFLKSKMKEFIFTQFGLILLSRVNAAGTKVQVHRFDYNKNSISGVMFETAGVGMTDYSCGIKFGMGGLGQITMDIVKEEQEQAKRVYLVLADLSREQVYNDILLNTAKGLLSKVILQGADTNWAANTTDILMNKYEPKQYTEIFVKHGF